MYFIIFRSQDLEGNFHHQTHEFSNVDNQNTLVILLQSMALTGIGNDTSIGKYIRCTQ